MVDSKKKRGRKPKTKSPLQSSPASTRSKPNANLQQDDIED